MVLLDVSGFSVGLLAYLTACVHCQVPPDLGPAEPTFETCETIVCPKNSNCVDDMGYVSCICNPGKTGVNCTIDDPCLERKTNCPAGSTCFGDCEPNIICEGATGFAHCRGCVAGWTGMQCEKDIDECADEIKPCLNGGKCINTKGDFKCECKKEWTGKVCDCERGSYCDTEMEEVRKDTDEGSGGTQLINNFTLLFLSISFFVTRVV